MQNFFLLIASHISYLFSFDRDISFLYDLALADQPQGKASASDPSSVRAVAKQKEVGQKGVYEYDIPLPFDILLFAPVLIITLFRTEGCIAHIDHQ